MKDGDPRRGKEYLVKGDVEDVEEGKVNVAEGE